MSELGQVYRVELLSLLVTYSPAISKLIEVAGKTAIRLNIFIIIATVIVSTKATHVCLVGARQNHLCSGGKGLVLGCIYSLCVCD